MKHALLLFALPLALRAQTAANGTLLFQNLAKLTSSWSVDAPGTNNAGFPEGPKGLAAADFDGDGRNDAAAGNHDGTVSVLFGAAGGGFEGARFFTAGDPRGLRDVIAANVMGDPRPEIIAAHPFEGRLYIFSIAGGAGSRTFGPPQTVITWPGARSVAAGDFNGDGLADLAVGGAGDGFREYRGDGAGGFEPQMPLSVINAGPFLTFSAKPVFTMQAWRRSGETRDRLAVSFAGAGYVWFLSSSPGTPLGVSSLLPLMEDESIYDLAMAKVSAASQLSGEPDLLTAVTTSGEIFIRHHSGAAGDPAYTTMPQQRLAVPGAPRAMTLRDLNGDNWIDLLVVARNAHTASLFRNNAGVLELKSQTPSGSSPREIVCADFTGDGQADAAVINRQSRDVTLHRIDPATGWFMQHPLVQRIAGGARSPVITNIDGLPGGELLYLSPTTGSVTILKLSPGTQPSLQAPVRYSMGVRPHTLTTPDLNGDGRPDLMVSSLGNWTAQGGIAYRLQLADRTFGPLQSLNVPTSFNEGLVAQITRDFNADGRVDLILVSNAGRIAFLEGTPAGLVHRRTEPFIYTYGALAAADLDQDGDADLAGAGAYGELAVVENNGHWFDSGPYSATVIPSQSLSGFYGLTVEDRNGDSDPDLTLSGFDAVTSWDGGTGLSFSPAGTAPLATTLDTTRFDYDGDGYSDTFALCPANTTASIFKGSPANPFGWWAAPWTPYAVPSVAELATGDMDNDGRPDLAGVGEHLWIALSGLPSPPLMARAFLSTQPEITGVVINEILADTEEYVAPNQNKPADLVEIFNGSAAAIDLSQWRLVRVPGPGETPKPDFIFPGVTLASGARVVVYCREKPGAWEAPFKLPAEGGTLRLLNAAAVRMDEVSYPAQQPDVSFGRLFDGARDFVFSPFPSAGSTNYDNGPVAPSLSFTGVDTTLLRNGTWRFRAKAWSSSGIFVLSVHWREIVINGTHTPAEGIISLHDDGAHDDGEALDSVFAGDWQNPLPPGKIIEFYIRGTDFSWLSTTEPESPAFTAPGSPILNYTLGLPALPSTFEISEIVPRNHTGLTDENSITHDWLEWRHLDSAPAGLQNLYLSDALFEQDPAKLYALSRTGETAGPHEIRHVWLSNTPDSGTNPMHAPFGANREGDSIFLIRRLPSGATELLDMARFPAMPPDTAWARLGPRGPFVMTTPTPLANNAPLNGEVHYFPETREVIFAFSSRGRVEASGDLKTWSIEMPAQPNSGFERTLREPLQLQRFFRIR